MDVREELRKLPEPDPAAVDRVWETYQASRRTRRSGVWFTLGVSGLALAGAAALAVLVTPLILSDAPARTLAIDATSPPSQRWSEQVELDTNGRGVASGTDRNVEIAWESGTITAHVVPKSGTQLAVVTDEARVEVVGTVFSVTRDRLGVSTEVERGEVAVTCADGWTGAVTPETGPHTCLPIRPALLLQRADALDEAGADREDVLDALDRGLAASAEGSFVASELLARRMQVHLAAGRVDEAVRDGQRYLASEHATRAVEVRTNLARTVLTVRGCEAARPWLLPLEAQGAPLDRVLLAECLVASEPVDPERSIRILRDVVTLDGVDDSVRSRAQRTLDSLGAR